MFKQFDNISLKPRVNTSGNTYINASFIFVLIAAFVNKTMKRDFVCKRLNVNENHSFAYWVDELLIDLNLFRKTLLLLNQKQFSRCMWVRGKYVDLPSIDHFLLVVSNGRGREALKP